MRPCSPRRPPSGTGGLWPVSHLQESLSGSCQHSVPRRACALSLAGDPQVPDACPDPDPCLLHICSSDHPHRSEPSGIPNVEGVRQAHLLVCGGGGGGGNPAHSAAWGRREFGAVPDGAQAAQELDGPVGENQVTYR